MSDLFKKIQELIDEGKGDPGRLQHILNSLRQSKELFSSDKQYLDSLLEQYPTEVSPTPGTEEKPSEVQELRKKIEELEKKVEKQSPDKESTFEAYELERIRRDLNHQKKQSELQQKADTMKKDIGTITLVAVIGGIFGINGLGHFMIGKNGTGVGYLVGGIAAMAIFGVITMGYGAILPWIIFLIASTLSARSSTKIWNDYIEVFVKEPTWKDIKKALEPKPEPETKSEMKKRTRKNSTVIVIVIILGVVVALWGIDNFVYDIGPTEFFDFFPDQDREPSKADLIRQHCILVNGVLYDSSTYFGKSSSPRCTYGTVGDLNAELTWWNPFD